MPSSFPIFFSLAPKVCEQLSTGRMTVFIIVVYFTISQFCENTYGMDFEMKVMFDGMEIIDSCG